MDLNPHDWRGITTITTFLLTNLIVVSPFSVSIPNSITSRIRSWSISARILSPATQVTTKSKVEFNYKNVPAIAVLFLLSITAIDRQVVHDGTLGADGIQPLNIMALFISLAYLSVSLDATGLFRFLAFWVTTKGRSSGKRLYLYLYLFFFTSGIIVGNDPVILSGTAFLAYFTQMAGIIPPTAWIYAQFSAANVASALLVSSNPTNLVLTGAFSLPYISYSAFLVLPTIITTIFLYPALLLLFAYRAKRTNSVLIPTTISLPDLGHSNLGTNILVDKRGAIIGSALLITTLVVLVGTSPLKPTIPVWRITLPGALIMLIRDISVDLIRVKSTRQVTRSQNSVVNSSPHLHTRDLAGTHSDLAAQAESRMHGVTATESHVLDNIVGAGIQPSRSISPRSFQDSPCLMGYIHKSCHTAHLYLPTVSVVVTRLPLPLLPFAFSMFILVQGLVHRGWITTFANWWTICERQAGKAGAVFLMTTISSLLCNVCGTNIGTTILLSRTLQLSISANPSTGTRTNPVIYALAFGSNIGAFTFSFSASLAGLLWHGILNQKGIYVTRGEFASLNVLLWIVATVVGSTVLYVQSKVVN